MRKNTLLSKRSIKRIGRRALEKLRLIEREKNPGFRRFLTDDLADELYIKLSHAFPNHNIDING